MLSKVSDIFYGVDRVGLLNPQLIETHLPTLTLFSLIRGPAAIFTIANEEYEQVLMPDYTNKVLVRGVFLVTELSGAAKQHDSSIFLQMCAFKLVSMHPSPNHCEPSVSIRYYSR